MRSQRAGIAQAGCRADWRRVMHFPARNAAWLLAKQFSAIQYQETATPEGISARRPTYHAGLDPRTRASLLFVVPVVLRCRLVPSANPNPQHPTPSTHQRHVIGLASPRLARRRAERSNIHTTSNVCRRRLSQRRLVFRIARAAPSRQQ
jgi:hypothetical protein